MSVRGLNTNSVAGLGLALCLVLAAPPAALAEVGSSAGSDGYIIFGIGDDPEPIGTIWGPLDPGEIRRMTLNTDGADNEDGRPSMLANPADGRLLVAWAENSPAGYDVVLSYVAGAAWVDPIALADSPADELDPHLAIDPSNGDVHLFYWVNDGDPRVLHRQAPADLSTWSDPVRVSPPGEIACRPTGVFHDGLLRVAYEVHAFGLDQTPREVVLARREGSSYIPEIVAVTHHAGEIRPGVHSHAGRLWVDWIDADDELAWSRVDAAGQWEPTRYEPYQGELDRDFHVRPGIRGKVLE